MPTSVTWKYHSSQPVFVNGEAVRRTITSLAVRNTNQPFYYVNGYSVPVPEHKIKPIPPAQTTLSWTYPVGTRVFVGTSSAVRTIQELVVGSSGRARYKVSGSGYTQLEKDLRPLNW